MRGRVDDLQEHPVIITALILLSLHVMYICHKVIVQVICTVRTLVCRWLTQLLFQSRVAYLVG